MDYEKKSGIVISSNQGIAKVQMRHSYACSGEHANCPHNAVLENVSADGLVVEASDSIGVRPGQLVEVTISSRHLMIAAFIAYMIPLIGLFSGYLVGVGLAHLVKLINHTEIIGIVFAALGLVVSLFATIKLGKTYSPEYTITSILKRNISGCPMRRNKREANSPEEVTVKRL
ncbi:hypothetical protein CEE34_04135 [Candidatus Aerophobetes bacterium Ae_b3a]|nr:MAG: hypothetical protein CEE34_04135 [Candidatus Aerophobetes bacterium Ae_b3a]